MDIKGFPPRCFLIGAQKAGTTYLANLLEQNPEIHVSNPKETDFFTGRMFNKGFDWYRSCFPEDIDKVLIDASTSYSAAFPVSDPRSKDETHSFNGVAKRIIQEVPDARFLYIVRNPIKRVYSAYWHFVRTGVETRPFHEVITTDDEGREYYFLLSDYFEQLENYLRVCDMDRINVLIFEEFIQSPADCLISCFRFLNVSENVEIDYGPGKHKSFRYSGILSKANHLLAPRGGLRPVLGKMKKLVPAALVRQGMKFATTSIPPMETEDYLLLADYFLPRIEKFEKQIGHPLLDLWMPDQIPGPTE